MPAGEDSLRHSALGGDVKAQIAVAYRNSLILALQFDRGAPGQVHRIGQYELGRCLEHSVRVAPAAVQYRSSVYQANSFGQNALQLVWLALVRRNRARMYPLGQVNFGYCLENPVEMAKARARAADYYRFAVDQENPMGQVAFGWGPENGLGFGRHYEATEAALPIMSGDVVRAGDGEKIES